MTENVGVRQSGAGRRELLNREGVYLLGEGMALKIT